jgi:ribose transport system ATP-binding protein
MSKLLAIRHLSKNFGGQLALDDVDLDLGRGRTHALVGQNGSGKSTLIKILAGYHDPDPGAEATFEGSPFPLGDPSAPAKHGIRFVHQDLGLVDAVSSVENLALGFGYRTRAGARIDWKAEARLATEALADLGFDQIDVRMPVAMLTPAQKTAVAIARALQGWEEHASLLVLDEPTATLPGADVERLFGAIRRLKAKEVSILYVSHHLDEVFELADDVTVLRDGRRVTTVPTGELTRDSMIELIVGHAVESGNAGAAPPVDGKPRLTVDSLVGGRVQDVSLTVRPGEVLGIAGITGSGREDLAGLLTGQRLRSTGRVRIDGAEVGNYAPRDALQAGMASVPADRGSEGVVAGMGVRHNLTLGSLRRHWRGARLRHRDETAEAAEWVKKLAVKTAGTEVPIATLSGGNQQKVLFGKSLRLDPTVLVLDEPTRGIDVGAKEEIHALIDSAAASGAAVLVASTDADELVRVCSRVLIMVDGRIAQEFTGADLVTERIETAQLQSADAA